MDSIYGKNRVKPYQIPFLGVCIKYLQPNLALGKQAYQSSNHTNTEQYQGPAEACRATGT